MGSMAVMALKTCQKMATREGALDVHSSHKSFSRQLEVVVSQVQVPHCSLVPTPQQGYHKETACNSYKLPF